MARLLLLLAAAAALLAPAAAQQDIDPEDLEKMQCAINLYLKYEETYLAEPQCQTMLEYITNTAQGFEDDATAFNEENIDLDAVCPCLNLFSKGEVKKVTKCFNQVVNNYKEDLTPEQLEQANSVDFQELDALCEELYCPEQVKEKKCPKFCKSQKKEVDQWYEILDGCSDVCACKKKGSSGGDSDYDATCGFGKLKKKECKNMCKAAGYDGFKLDKVKGCGKGKQCLCNGAATGGTDDEETCPPTQPSKKACKKFCGDLDSYYQGKASQPCHQSCLCCPEPVKKADCNDHCANLGLSKISYKTKTDEGCKKVCTCG